MERIKRLCRHDRLALPVNSAGLQTLQCTLRVVVTANDRSVTTVHGLGDYAENGDAWSHIMASSEAQFGLHTFNSESYGELSMLPSTTNRFLVLLRQNRGAASRSIGLPSTSSL